MSKYSKEFKEEAIRLSDEIGNKKAQATWDNKGNNRNTRERKPDKT